MTYGRNDRDDDRDDRGCDNGHGGRNSKATMSGDTSASVAEDSGKYTVSGELDVRDGDRGEAGTRSIGSKAGTYGTFSVDAKGNWIYKLDNSRAAVQRLDKGEKAYDSFTVYSIDGTAQKTVKITVNGADEKPQSDGKPVVGGTATGAVKEDAPVNTSTGKLTVDGKEVSSGFESLTKAGSYGSFKLNANGSWTYTLDNGKAGVQALNEGQSVTESFVVKTRAVDGRCDDDIPSVSKTIVITVNGTNETTGTEILLGAVVEDGNTQSSAIGQVNGGPMQPVSGLAGLYGALSLTAAGAWSYTLDNSKATVQTLAQGEKVDDALIVTSVAGAPKTIKITVTGTNDAPAAANDAAGYFLDLVHPLAAQQIAVLANDTDVDHGAVLSVKSVQAVSALGAAVSIGPGGTVTYDAGLSAAINAITDGAVLNDSFSYVAQDEFGATSTAVVAVTLIGQGTASG